MEKMVAAFPVLPGKDPRVVVTLVEGRKDEYRQSRQRAGVHVERAWEQTTPMGNLVVAYIESERPFGATNADMAASGLAIDRDFFAALRDVHGFDPSQPAPGEPPELLADWVDDAVTERKKGMAFCAPIREGAADAARTFANEAFVLRRDEHTASRRSLGVTHETVMLNHAPTGDIICVYLEGDDSAEGNRRFAGSRSAYDVWFKDQAAKVFPPEIDFNEPVPPVAEIFDSLTL